MAQVRASLYDAVPHATWRLQAKFPPGEEHQFRPLQPCQIFLPQLTTINQLHRHHYTSITSSTNLAFESRRHIASPAHNNSLPAPTNSKYRYLVGTKILCIDSALNSEDPSRVFIPQITTTSPALLVPPYSLYSAQLPHTHHIHQVR